MQNKTTDLLWYCSEVLCAASTLLQGALLCFEVLLAALRCSSMFRVVPLVLHTAP